MNKKAEPVKEPSQKHNDVALVIDDPDPLLTKPVTITLSVEEAEAMQNSFSDILCWTAGFEAGRAGSDLPDGPMGISHLRDMNIKLKSALNKADPK